MSPYKVRIYDKSIFRQKSFFNDHIQNNTKLNTHVFWSSFKKDGYKMRPDKKKQIRIWLFIDFSCFYLLSCFLYVTREKRFLPKYWTCMFFICMCSPHSLLLLFLHLWFISRFITIIRSQNIHQRELLHLCFTKYCPTTVSFGIFSSILDFSVWIFTVIPPIYDSNYELHYTHWAYLLPPIPDLFPYVHHS